MLDVFVIFFGVTQPIIFFVVLTIGSAVKRTPTIVGLDHSDLVTSQTRPILELKITVVKMDYSSHLINMKSSWQHSKQTFQLLKQFTQHKFNSIKCSVN
jgi:hypothetical protein